MSSSSSFEASQNSCLTRLGEDISDVVEDTLFRFVTNEDADEDEDEDEDEDDKDMVTSC